MNASAIHMVRSRNIPRYLAAAVTAASTVFAQSFVSSEVSIQTPPPPPVVGRVLAPFHLERRVVVPARLANSPRLESLIRGGNLYLTVQDAIALALENNLDIAVQRYGPFLAREDLRRAQGGGVLRQDITIPVAAGPVSVSPIGVSGNASGLAAGAGIGSVAFLVGSGPNPPNLDPQIGLQVQFGHSTTPQTNLGLNQTTALVNSYRQYSLGYSQQFLTGTAYSVNYFSGRNFLNSPNPTLNPYVSSSVDLTITQSLLQGFRRAVNDRQIRVAKNNIKVTNLTFKLQLITTIGAVLNLYWDLVSFNEDVRIKEQQLAMAKKLHEDNQKRVQAGALASIEVTRAAAQVSAGEEALPIARTNLAQQETVLKNALSRTGVEDPRLDEVRIIPLDTIQIPKIDQIRPITDLMQDAAGNRPELEQSRISLQNSKLNLEGTKNSLLPSLGAFADFTNNALGGSLNPLYNNCCGAPDPYFLGGAGHNLLEIFRRNFPNYSVGFSFNIPLRNRAAQADYAMDQLKLRTEEIQLRRTLNQIRVEVKNAVIGLQQARVRYETAVDTRKLAEQTLEAEQKRFEHGATGADVTTVIQAQQDLANDQSIEVQAMAAYTHAKIAFDQALGQTLEVNHVKLDEAELGHVERMSLVPDSVPNQKKQ
jgi:outer membrane protein